MRTIDQLIQQEVIHNASHMVSTLAKDTGYVDYSTDMTAELELAFEACTPVPDYEEAASQNGWYLSEVGEWYRPAKDSEPSNHSVDIAVGTVRQIWVDTAEEACDWDSIETDDFDREIFEHGIVSNWLAEKLEAKGERIVRDLMGFTIWGRTTTGQAIASDHVIETIYKEFSA